MPDSYVIFLFAVGDELVGPNGVRYIVKGLGSHAGDSRRDFYALTPARIPKATIFVTRVEVDTHYRRPSR